MVKNAVKKLGFIEDIDGSQLRETFKDNARFKEIHIDTYSENPLSSTPLFMLLLRTYEENVAVTHKENRLILKKNDKYKTQVMNIMSPKITECLYRISGNYIDFVLNVQNIYYKISILN